MTFMLECVINFYSRNFILEKWRITLLL